MRRVIPILAAGLCGIIIIADTLVTLPRLNHAASILLEGAIILSAFALLLGMINLFTYHVKRVHNGERARWQSWVIVISLPLMFILGLIDSTAGAVRWAYKYLIMPLVSTMGAVLVFYAVNAAWQLLQLRSALAVVLLVSSLVFLAVWVPLISGLTPLIPALRSWLVAIPLGAGMRGILLGSAIGVTVSALRILFTVERPYINPSEER